MLGLLVTVAIVCLILFLLAPRWFGRASTTTWRRTKRAFRRSSSEFKKGAKESDEAKEE